MAAEEKDDVFCAAVLDVEAGWVSVLELVSVVICMAAEEKDARSSCCHRIWIG